MNCESWISLLLPWVKRIVRSSMDTNTLNYEYAPVKLPDARIDDHQQQGKTQSGIIPLTMTAGEKVKLL